MKKRLIQALLLISVTSALCTTAFAINDTYDIQYSVNSIQASEYISSYNAGISFSNNNIIVNFAVYGTGYMDTIGAQKIALQKYQSGSWADVKCIFRETGTPRPAKLNSGSAETEHLHRAS